MDDWYEELADTARGFGLEPLQAMILTMYDACLCSQDGDFGPEWQGISENDRKAMGCEEEDEENDDEAQ
ncbi:MAG: hypothetical protein HQ464_05940 [Planctomycetes bacterium]|nr:hypothetical protein [Planctomycetota bacterium]